MQEIEASQNAERYLMIAGSIVTVTKKWTLLGDFSLLSYYRIQLYLFLCR